MKQSIKMLLHLGFWLGYFLLMAIVLFAARQGNDIPPEDYGYFASFIVGVGIIPPAASFYAHYHFLFPRYLQHRRILASILASVCISAVAMLLGFLFVKLTSEEAFGCIETGLPYAIPFTFGLATLVGVIALILKGFLTWYDELKLKEALMEKTHRMELALVKSQLDPHFLFNTINNIDVLITKDPEKASQYLNKLSDIMRFMLYETKTEKIPLAKELAYIEKFIELQKIRTANEHYVHYELSGCPEHKAVAPMVFIPFIENAFKHSANKKVDEAVKIAIRIKEDAIAFHCSNKYNPHTSASNGANGLGNELIQKRLKLLYPDNHQLEVSRDGHQYQVDLTLQHASL